MSDLPLPFKLHNIWSVASQENLLLRGGKGKEEGGKRERGREGRGKGGEGTGLHPEATTKVGAYVLHNRKLYVTCGMVPCLLTSTDR